MLLLSGKILADQILADLQQRLSEASIRPGLAAILVGDYIESHKYVSLKEERAKEVGIHFEKYLFPASATPETLVKTLETLNERSDIHGILVQLPLPKGLPTDDIIHVLDPRKDVDGFHSATLRRFLEGDCESYPVFPRAIIELIRATGVPLKGEQGIVIVNSDLLGTILQTALRLEGLQAEYILSTAPKELIAKKTTSAKVVVTACGIPNLLTAAMLRADAIVIDGGNVHVDGKVRGDVERETVEGKVAWLSPVPGGVGPVTIALLLKRTLELAQECSTPPSSS